MTGPDQWTDGRWQGPASEGRTERIFRAGLGLKLLDGVLETVGGIVLFFLPPARINHVLRWLTAHELAQDPTDFVARHLLASASHLTASTTLFGAVYLLVHGLAKVVLVIQIFRERIWAFSGLIGVTTIFIAYELYRMTYRPSFGLAALVSFDVVIVGLTWHEHRRALRRLRTR